MTELLVGTKKGLFVLRGDAGAEKPFDVAARAFPGNVVEFAIRDPRSGRYFASVTSGHFGPRVMHTMDPTGEWEPTTGLGYPEGSDWSLERIWSIKPGEADGLMYAGVAPAGLFASADGGMTWELNRALYDQPTRSSWQPGAGGLCLHSIATWPGDPSRLAIGISAVGVWLSEDGGESWRHGNEGLVPRYIPEDAREGTLDLCVHNMHRAPLRPERLFMQFHGGVYRSDDAGESWISIADGLPADFGFPMNSDGDRVTVDGRARVYGTRECGRVLDVAERRAPPGGRLPHDPPARVRGRRRGRGHGPVLRGNVRRRVRVRRRGSLLVHGARAARARELRPSRLVGPRIREPPRRVSGGVHDWAHGRDRLARGVSRPPEPRARHDAAPGASGRPVGCGGPAATGEDGAHGRTRAPADRARGLVGHAPRRGGSCRATRGPPGASRRVRLLTSAVAEHHEAGVRSERYREVAAGGAEPTRESCRGRHAQVPGPREVRQPEHDADETPDTCSSRSPVSGRRQDASRRMSRPQVVAPRRSSASRHSDRNGTRSSASRCWKPSSGWIPSVCTASSGTKAVQSAIETFG